MYTLILSNYPQFYRKYGNKIVKIYKTNYYAYIIVHDTDYSVY
jgi:trehalose-6-phosphate synthase